MTTQHEYEITEQGGRHTTVRTTISDDSGRFDVEVASVGISPLHAIITTCDDEGVTNTRVNRDQALVLAHALLTYATQETAR